MIFSPRFCGRNISLRHKGTYNVEHNIIHQDNESTLRMLINGKKSYTPRSKHIKAKFFLAKDYHNKGKIEFAKYHTEKIWVW